MRKIAILFLALAAFVAIAPESEARGLLPFGGIGRALVRGHAHVGHVGVGLHGHNANLNHHNVNLNRFRGVGYGDNVGFGTGCYAPPAALRLVPIDPCLNGSALQSGVYGNGLHLRSTIRFSR